MVVGFGSYQLLKDAEQGLNLVCSHNLKTTSIKSLPIIALNYIFAFIEMVLYLLRPS